jgi:hypothetical protein
MKVVVTFGRQLGWMYMSDDAPPGFFETFPSDPRDAESVAEAATRRQTVVRLPGSSRRGSFSRAGVVGVTGATGAILAVLVAHSLPGGPRSPGAATSRLQRSRSHSHLDVPSLSARREVVCNGTLHMRRGRTGKRHPRRRSALPDVRRGPGASTISFDSEGTTPRAQPTNGGPRRVSKSSSISAGSQFRYLGR